MFSNSSMRFTWARQARGARGSERALKRASEGSVWAVIAFGVSGVIGRERDGGAVMGLANGLVTGATRAAALRFASATVMRPWAGAAGGTGFAASVSLVLTNAAGSGIISAGKDMTAARGARRKKRPLDRARLFEKMNVKFPHPNRAQKTKIPQRRGACRVPRWGK